MKFPKIDLSSLPDLGTLTGMFGSYADPGTPTDPGPPVDPGPGLPGPDDTIVVLATLVYDSAPPTGGLF